MSKRIRKSDVSVLAILLIVGIPIYLITQLIQSVSTTQIIALIIIVSIIFILRWYINYNKKQKRLTYLYNKYKDGEIVTKILQGYIWQGQTEEQLKDSIGIPEAVDSKVLKTKTVEVWKYDHKGANRFGLRITIENGKVVGWDQKT